MPDVGDDSRLAWLVEPQQHDVALQQPLVVATATAERTAGGKRGKPSPDDPPDGADSADAGPKQRAEPQANIETPAPLATLVPEHAGDNVESAAIEPHAPVALSDSAGTALERRRAPLSVRLVTVVRGTGAPLGRLGAPRRTRPMSFLAQFVIAMVATMTLFTTLVIASPIAGGTPFRGSFETVAGAVPWIPTPTPTPRPTPTPAPPPPPAGGYGPLPGGPLPPPPRQANPGSATVRAYISQVFGPWAGQAINVANCESGYDPNAWNPYELLRSHAAGVFQILYPSTWAETPYWASNPFDYRLNIQGAWWLFSRDGHTWREWACGTILGYN